MGMVWQMAALSGNERWKGLTWGMLPLHASGVAACTYHFFYNRPDLSFLVLLQAALTLAGNSTCAVAAARLAITTSASEAATPAHFASRRGGSADQRSLRTRQAEQRPRGGGSAPPRV